MDAPEYVGRRAERALGLLPAALAVVAAVCAVAGVVGLWRLTTPAAGVGGNAAGTLWQRVTMAVASGYDVAPLAWGALALVVLAGLARSPWPLLPEPGPRTRRAATLLAAAVVVLSVVAVVLVVVWAVLTRGEVSFSIEVPGDQDGGRVTTQVGTYVTDPWVGLLRVVPAVVAVVLSGGALAALLHPVRPVGTAPARAEEPTLVEPAAPVPRPGPTDVPPASATPSATREDGAVAEPVLISDPAVFTRDGAASSRSAGGRGSGGAARFARSLASAGNDGREAHAGLAGLDGLDGRAARDGASPRPERGSADPLADWTMGPGTTSDVAFRRPGAGSATTTTTEPAPHAAAAPSDPDGTPVEDGDGPAQQGAVRARDPYRWPGA